MSKYIIFQYIMFIYYKIDNESLSSQRGTCNKVGSGFEIRTPEKLQQRCF